MLKYAHSAISALAPLISDLVARIGGSSPTAIPSLPALISPTVPRSDWLSIPIRDQNAEDSACRKFEMRGQFLARQDRWENLSDEMRKADANRDSTPCGMPIAELMAFGARSDVVLAVEHALQDGRANDETVLIDGIMDLETLRRDHQDDMFVTLIVALAHIDIGWAWRSAGWNSPSSKQNFSKCAAHFDRASDLLAPFCGIEQNSPAIAGARCALLAGQRDPNLRIADDYEDLIDLDPHNHRHMRALGNHLLPRWFGSYQQLELEARRTAARTQDIWGAGGYTWVCFDAIASDEKACAQVDVEFFIEGLRDIVAARPEQEMINLLAAYCSVAMGDDLGKSATSDLARLQIVDCANWLIRDHLTEVHPLIWAHAAEGFDNNTRVTSVGRFAARGRDNALMVISDQFREEFAGGRRVIFTPDGLQTHPV